MEESEYMDTTKVMDVIRVGQIEIRFRLAAAQTGGNLTMFEFQVPARARVPVPHSHEGFDETVYGLDGSLCWTIGGRKVNVGPGEVLFIPRGIVHQFENLGAESARQLSVITPGLLGPGFFREMGDIINPGGPLDIHRVVAVMQRHGLRAAPPSSPAGTQQPAG